MQQSQSAMVLTPVYMWGLHLIIMLVTFGATLFIVASFLDTAIAPKAGQIAMIAGLLLSLPAVFYHNTLKANTTGRNRMYNSGSDQEGQALAQIVLAYILAEFPGIVGLLYYAMAREMAGTAVLLFVSLALMVWMRPK